MVRWGAGVTCAEQADVVTANAKPMARCRIILTSSAGEGQSISHFGISKSGHTH
jgi:hypothetical protein